LTNFHADDPGACRIRIGHRVGLGAVT
jgi:hypothetical protein